MLLTVMVCLHLATVFIPMAAWLLAAARVTAYVLVLPLSLLALLGMFRVMKGLSTTENRATATLTALAPLGALLPILVGLLGNP